MNNEKEKWTSDKLPKGFPTECGRKLLNDVIQDLSDERYQKTQNGKVNVIWERLVSGLLESGREELRQRTQVNEKLFQFSMDNPFIYVLVILLLAFIAFLVYRFNLPLLFL